ncbi:MAG: hypothetical protein SPE99_12060 [Blautia sp.]|nr:hypothetical protein [Blautia sp.]
MERKEDIKTVIDGNAFYELDLECIRRRNRKNTNHKKKGKKTEITEKKG